MKTIVKMFVAAIVAMFVAAWVESLGVGYRMGFVAVYFGTALGIFYGIEAVESIVRKRRSQSERYDTIRFRSGMDYKQAAVFIGTACLFVGTPQECEDVADDMQHYAQQAEMRELTGNEVFDVL